MKEFVEQCQGVVAWKIKLGVMMRELTLTTPRGTWSAWTNGKTIPELIAQCLAELHPELEPSEAEKIVSAIRKRIKHG